MQKFFIKNRKEQKVAVVVEEARPQKGLAFIMHGLGGFKEQPQLEVMAEALHEAGYTVVTFDTTNTFGESDGRYEDATTTNYYEDLEDLIAWSATQPWYAEPFVLVGFSLGGLCTALYAERHPEKVKALAPIGTVVSGRLSIEGHAQHEEWKKWKETGWRETPSESKPGMIKRLPWSHIEDRRKYDLLAPITPSESPPPRGGERSLSSPRGGEVRRGGIMTDRLTMPVLLVVGEKDESCPPEHQKILYNALPGPKELHLIPDAPHTFREPQHLNALETIITTWLATLDKNSHTL